MCCCVITLKEQLAVSWMMCVDKLYLTLYLCYSVFVCCVSVVDTASAQYSHTLGLILMLIIALLVAAAVLLFLW